MAYPVPETAHVYVADHLAENVGLVFLQLDLRAITGRENALRIGQMATVDRAIRPSS